MRVFLANYFSGSDAPVSINVLPFPAIASSAQLFEAALGLDLADLSIAEAQALRPSVYRALAGRHELPYIKAHDANIRLPSGEPLFPPDVTRAAVYLVRDPRDVAVSWAQHRGVPLDEIITHMGSPGYALTDDRRGRQLPQPLSTWSGHVRSWADEVAFPVHVVCYEDLVAEPEATFGAIVTFLGLEHDSARLERAISFSTIGELRDQEARDGFHEAPAHLDRFFGEGRPGRWSEVLGSAQAAQIVADHAPVMARFGYQPAGGGGDDPAPVSRVRN